MSYMIIKKGKVIFKIVIIILLIIILSLIFKNFLSQSQNIKLSFFDVGQGDACLIKTPNNKIILIDGGPDNLILRSLGSQMPFYKRRIHMVIVSHFHQDHIVGLIEVFRRYKVEYLILGEAMKTFYPGEVLFFEAKKQNTKIIYVDDEIRLVFQKDCYLNILNPTHISSNNDNDSLIAKLSCGNFSFLTSGDNEQKIEEQILETSFDLSAQVFKASHHGSKTSNSYAFLEAISPSLMVISVGASNRFGHPSPSVLNTANSLDIDVKRTDKLGTINILVGIE